MSGAQLGHSAGGSAAALARQLRPTAGYTDPGALALNTSRQPSAANATQVIMTVRLGVNDNQNLTANVQVSPDNATWDTIAEPGNDFDVSGLLGVTGNSNMKVPVTFEIPAGWFYRLTQTGTGTASIARLRERAL